MEFANFKHCHSKYTVLLYLCFLQSAIINRCCLSQKGRGVVPRKTRGKKTEKSVSKKFNSFVMTRILNVLLFVISTQVICGFFSFSYPVLAGFLFLRQPQQSCVGFVITGFHLIHLIQCASDKQARLAHNDFLLTICRWGGITMNEWTNAWDDYVVQVSKRRE